MRDFALIGATLIMAYALIVTAGWYVTHRNNW